MSNPILILSTWLRKNPDYNQHKENFVIEFDLISFSLLPQAFVEEQDDCYYLRNSQDEIIKFDFKYADKIVQDLGIEFLKELCD